MKHVRRGHGGGIQDEMIAVPRLEHALHNSIPGRENMTRNVGPSAFHPLTMFDEIRADDLNRDQLR